VELAEIFQYLSPSRKRAACNVGADGTVPWGTNTLLDADGLRGAGHCIWKMKEAGRMLKHPASLE
jgi:hypothetical protein